MTARRAAPVSARSRTPKPPAPGRGRPATLAGGALALLVIAGAAWLFFRPAPFSLTATPDQNILLVTIDTLRADAPSFAGGPASTPNLDRLASGGARFTFAHAQAVVTLPSHTTILTGQWPYTHGMRDNSGYRVREGTSTLATRLKALGFATGAFVGGFPLTKRFGLTPGFDEYDDQMPEMHGAVTFSMPERSADVVVTRALDWMGRQQGRFFSWVHVFDAHSPYRPPAEYAARYASQPYNGEVAWIDHALGPLFDRLATLPRPTTVIVTADHGESLGEHGELTHGMFAYEATLHVPLIVARVVPGNTHVPGGRVIDAPVRHVDIAPTILEAVGAAADPSLAGASLVDLIRTGAGTERPAYFESMTYNLVRGWAPLRGVVVGRQKYIDLPIAELFDLSADPKELRNTAPAQRDRSQVLLNTLKGFNMAPPDRPGRETAETLAALKSLGYISGSAPARAAYTEEDDPKRLVEVDRDLHAATDLYQDGKVPEAIALLERVVARRPDTADAYISLAHAYWESGRVPLAIATLERALTKGAPDRDVRIRLGIYLAESHTDTKKAIAVLEGLPVTDVEALNALGLAYGDAKRYPDALTAFRRVLTLDPTNGLAFQNTASMLLRQAQESRDAGTQARLVGEAEEYARRAIASDPALAKAHVTIGVIFAQTNRPAEAIESWKRAVDLDGTEFDAMYNLTLTLAKAGRLDDARAYAQRFVATAPAALYGPDIAELRKFLGR